MKKILIIFLKNIYIIPKRLFTKKKYWALHFNSLLTKAYDLPKIHKKNCLFRVIISIENSFIFFSQFPT